MKGRRGTVVGEDNLAAVAVEVVKGVEELLLGSLLSRQKLNVVDKKKLKRAVAAAELVAAAMGDGCHEVVGELLRSDVLGITLAGSSVQGDGLQEMGLA